MTSSKYNLLSTSALAKRLELTSKVLFELLQEKAWIERADDQWKLTGKGQFEGGDYIQSKKYGEYIGWPESIIENRIFDELFNRPLRTRIIAKDVANSSHRFNALLVERGWQKRFHRGWVLTEAGKQVGGSEGQDEETGVPFTLWPRDILNIDWLQSALEKLSSPEPMNSPEPVRSPAPLSKPKQTENNKRQQKSEKASDSKSEPQAELNLVCSSAEPPFTTLDGHIALFSEDALVDNWLYLMGVSHCYRYQMADAALGIADFYLPSAQVYVEVWHSGEQGKAMSLKLGRLEHYKKIKANVIEVQQDQTHKLDQTLPKALLGFGITVF